MGNEAGRQFVGFFSILFLYAACSVGSTESSFTAGGSPDGGGPAAQGSPGLTDLTISTGSLQPSFDPNVLDYEVSSLNSLYPVEVTAKVSGSSYSLVIHGSPVQSGVPSSFTLKPKEDVTIVLRSPAAGSTTYTLHYLPSGLPASSVSSSDGAGKEDVLLSTGSYLLLMDRSGAPLYYRTFPSQSVMNFQQHRLASGQTVYSALVGKSSGPWVLGVDHLMDAQFRDIGEVQLVPGAAHAVLPAEGHDFLMLGDRHYVTMSYVQRTVDLSEYNPSWSSAAPVMNGVVQEVDHGAAVFEWDSANFPSLYSDSVDGNAFQTQLSDYLHLNSIDIDPADGNFIFSLRHTNSILKVDRKTGQTLWTLGGREDDFDLSPDQVFSHQHHVRVQSDGSLLVFDNGNGMHQTRSLSFTLDETNKKVTAFQVVYDKPADDPQTSFMGSQSRLGPGRYLFGWGGWAGNTIAPAVSEVIEGQPVWSLTFTGPGVFSYRALPVAAL